MSLWKSNVKEAYRSLVTAKQRTVLAIVGVVIGIGSVIGMISIGEIVRSEALRQFKEMGVDVVQVMKDFDSPDPEARFRWQDIRDLELDDPDVLETAPFLNSGESLFFRGGEQYAQLFGVSGSFFSINKLRMRDGRFISDLDHVRYFCVLGGNLAQTIRDQIKTDLVGRKIRLGQRIYTVIGVLENVAEGGGMRPGGINDAVFLPLSTGLRSFANAGIDQFLARVKSGKTTAQVKKNLADFFSMRNKGLIVEVRTAEEIVTAMEKQMALYTLFLGAIGSIALIVGGIGVMNVMLISVSERRREIGVRRALGAQRHDIQTQFILESVALCLIGGLIGVLLGVAVSYLFAYFSDYPYVISRQAIILGFVVSGAVGIFFGYYPARKAAILDPIQALRS